MSKECKAEPGKYLTAEDIKNDHILVRQSKLFYGCVKALKQFGDHCTMELFVDLFGESEGERLLYCFVRDAKRDIYHFMLTYLTNEQKFVMVANIIRDKDSEMYTPYLLSSTVKKYRL